MGLRNKSQRSCQLHVAESGLELVLFFAIYVLKLISLSIAYLQCCVSFHCMVKWVNYTLQISTLFEVLSPYRSLHSTFFFFLNWSIVDWFTVLCQSTAKWLSYTHIYITFIFISIIVYHRVLNISCATWEHLAVYPFKCNSLHLPTLTFQSNPLPPHTPQPPSLATTSLSCVSMSLFPCFR